MHLELEKLINIAIQDGILNERERQILISKARALGIDEHEFEMTLEGVMSKLQNNNDGLTKNSQIVKCPNCGGLLASLSNVCEFCGFVVNKTTQNGISLEESIKRLENLTVEIKSYPKPTLGKYLLIVLASYLTCGLYLIIHFFVKSKNGSFANLEARCTQQTRLIDTYFGSDSKVKELLALISADIERIKKERKKSNRIAVIGALSIFVFLLIIGFFSEKNEEQKAQENIKIEKKVLSQIDSLILIKNYDQAIIKTNELLLEKDIIQKKSEIQLFQLKMKIDNVIPMIKEQKFEEAALALSQITWNRIENKENADELSNFKKYLDYKKAANEQLPEKNRIIIEDISSLKQSFIPNDSIILAKEAEYKQLKQNAQSLSDSAVGIVGHNKNKYSFSSSNRAKELYRLMHEETDFYIENMEFRKALRTANELYELMQKYPDTPTKDREFDKIIDTIVKSLISDNKYDEAKKYCIEFKSEILKDKTMRNIKQLQN